MGLDDRDYMREVPAYEELIGRQPPHRRLRGLDELPGAPPPQRAAALAAPRMRLGGTRPWAWFLLGAIAMLVVVLRFVPASAPSSPAPATPPAQLPQPQFQVVPAPT